MTGVILSISACAPASRPLPGTSWVMIKAPSMNYFPYGSWQTPRDEWLPIGSYPSEEKCREALASDHVAEGPRPLDCIPASSHTYKQIDRFSFQ